MIAGLDPVNVAAFLGAGLLLNLTPGSDVMFASASGLAGGPRAGIAAALGVALGGLLHTALAAAGLAALLVASPLAFDAVRWLGAGYLLFLAVKYWRAGPAQGVAGTAGLGRAIRRGFVTNALNPKVALFVLAFLPQLTDPATGPVWQQILVLGLLFSTTGFFVTAGYGALAGVAGKALGQATGWMGKVAAVIFGLLALRLVVE
ncbi:LysE family translocator [Sinisalibacter lacisalsi]|uniref:Threonine transporter RhtB n=1 Tax=Sinisalibacter lacisalsi TaxID=1526570 RepID=A0ABQ1QAI4_9RHOB|nr:LysE family translocator [Sinisalibacter lacisalsi]GGD20117.1 threonine transporter RhtB [Sinisalibacter lacisalsi]